MPPAAQEDDWTVALNLSTYETQKIFSTYSHLFESEGIGIGIGRIEVFGLIFEKYAVKWAASY